MLNIIDIPKTGLCFVGDIHGDFSNLAGLMKHTELTDTAYIICGDCGFGFNKPEYYKQILGKVKKTAAKLDNVFFFLRGNHDDPSYFDGKTIDFPNFYAMPDYTVIRTPIYNVLCVGGAVSVDRIDRMRMQCKIENDYMRFHKCSINAAKEKCDKVYWPDELPAYDEESLNELNEMGIKIDIVCTHTSPSFAQLTNKNGVKYWTDMDNTLAEDLFTERNVMDQIYDKLKSDGHPLYKWFYGHFHQHFNELIDGTQFIMLDMCRNGNFDMYNEAFPNDKMVGNQSYFLTISTKTDK